MGRRFFLKFVQNYRIFLICPNFFDKILFFKCFLFLFFTFLSCFFCFYLPKSIVSISFWKRALSREPIVIDGFPFVGI